MDPIALRKMFDVLEARKSGRLVRVEMPASDLRGAHLLRADLVGADLALSRMEHANLAGAKLGEAKLEGASLVGADLNGADLTAANLRAADLSEARIEGSCFVDADLRGAKLRLARGYPASLSGARIDKATCDASEFSDTHIIRWFRLGAVLVGMDEFSDAVRHACSAPSPVPGMPAPDLLRRTEVAAQKQRLARQMSLPPSAQQVDGLKALSLAPPSLSSLPPSGLVDDAPAALMAKVASASIPPAAGRELCGVKLETLIGQGHASSLWKGRDADGALLAVRVFDPERAHPLALAAFQRGLRAMNRAVIELGPEAGLLPLRWVGVGELMYASAYMENGSLLNVPALKLPTKRICALFREICEQVARLHDAGILHRALKPSNVLLADNLQPCLAEIDMASITELAELEQGAAGYAPYAAPEELLGSGTHSPTADVFALGRLLYFLLLGGDPDEPLDEVPKLAALAKQPAGLSRIIRKCTMRDPMLRYQWVPELIADLDRYESYAEVGIEGGHEANYLPYSISSLAPPPMVRVEVAKYPKTPFQDLTLHRALPAPAWISRRAEIALGAAGLLITLLCAGGLALIELPHSFLRPAGFAIAAGAALITLLGPQLSGRAISGRLALMVLGFVVTAVFVDPEWIAVQRWRWQLNGADPSARGRAVSRLTRAGVRQFEGVDLRKANLAGADLSQANFKHAQLSAADLSGAALMESDFEGADLTGATALDADFSRTNAEQARGFDSIACDSTTSLPKGWKCDKGHPARKR